MFLAVFLTLSSHEATFWERLRPFPDGSSYDIVQNDVTPFIYVNEIENNCLLLFSRQKTQCSSSPVREKRYVYKIIILIIFR